nr:MAG TPA: hypothetical protein [Caudoviricetes sp.]
MHYLMLMCHDYGTSRWRTFPNACLKHQFHNSDFYYFHYNFIQFVYFS